MRVTMIGFGEAARAFVSGWRSGNAAPSVAAYDIKLDDAAVAADMLASMASRGVDARPTPKDAVGDAELVFCLVTADQSEAAAAAAAPHLPSGTLWLDCNSCSPQTKRSAAASIARGVGRYVDVAIMAPVQPSGHRTPLLVSGEAAESAAVHLSALDMRYDIAGGRVGDASMVKMLRSVMVKGLEALVAECLLTARSAGVEEQVLQSLQQSDPAIDWRSRASYSLERMMLHGRRRAVEMREVAETIRGLGMPDRMATAIAAWQSEIGDLGLSCEGDDLAGRADAVLRALKTELRKRA